MAILGGASHLWGFSRGEISCLPDDAEISEVAEWDGALLPLLANEEIEARRNERVAQKGNTT